MTFAFTFTTFGCTPTPFEDPSWINQGEQAPNSTTLEKEVNPLFLAEKWRVYKAVALGGGREGGGPVGPSLLGWLSLKGPGDPSQMKSEMKKWNEFPGLVRGFLKFWVFVGFTFFLLPTLFPPNDVIVIPPTGVMYFLCNPHTGYLLFWGKHFSRETLVDCNTKSFWWQSGLQTPA